jgi:PAS domain S-box-containing protein
MGTTQDIDASKRAHLDMRSKNDMLEKAAEIIKMGTWEYFPESNTITWSKQTRRILGVDDDFPASADAFYECLYPEDAEKIKAAFLKTLADGSEYNLRLRCITKQGQHLIVRSACRARYDLFGKLIRVTGIFQDITNEKGEEE